MCLCVLVFFSWHDFLIFRIDDMKTMLKSVLAERKLSIQVVGFKESVEEAKEDDDKETVLCYHSGDGLQDKPNCWKETLKLHQVLLITN